MTMCAAGVAKLVEECGELLAALQLRDYEAIDNEAGDVLAACAFVGERMNLPAPVEEVLRPDLYLSVGYLLQVCGKRLAYWRTEEHPDGKGPLDQRMSNAIKTMAEAIDGHPSIDEVAAKRRGQMKLDLFRRWDAEPENNRLAIDGEPK